jgi:hypothetical protein
MSNESLQPTNARSREAIASSASRVASARPLVSSISGPTALSAQTPQWNVLGDTTGAAPGCSAAAGIAAIDAWFRAYNLADSAGLTRATSARRFVVSTGRFTPAEPFTRIESLSVLLDYVRQRARHRERLTLTSVHFYKWVHGQGRELGFMPIYVRPADDLGPEPLHGVGKAAYLCNSGVLVLNLAPRPAIMGPP